MKRELAALRLTKLSNWPPILSRRSRIGPTDVGVRVFCVVTASTIAGMYAFVADLGYCRMANDYAVSLQAMKLRLQSLSLIRKGTWDTLSEQNFKPETAKRNLQLSSHNASKWKTYPARYELLAVLTFRQGEISEGELAKYLRTDRVSARQIVRDFADRFDDVGRDGEDAVLRLPLELSLLNTS